MQRVALLAAVTLAAALPVDGFAQAAAPRAYNTVMEKLARGEPVIGGTIHTANPDTYCAVANAGFDFNGSRCSTARARTRRSKTADVARRAPVPVRSLWKSCPIQTWTTFRRALSDRYRIAAAVGR